MLRSDDIEAAISAGIITSAQAASLEHIAAERRRLRTFAVGREERFRLVGGFGDFFIAVGVLLLGIGLSYSAFLFLAKGPSWIGNYRLTAWFAFGTLLMWGIAEYLTGRLKLVAPSIVVVVFIALLAASTAITFPHGGTRFYLSASTLYGPLAALIMVILHYGRFRFPFSLLVIAILSVMVVVICAALLTSTFQGVSPLQLTWVAFACGIVVFWCGHVV